MTSLNCPNQQSWCYPTCRFIFYEIINVPYLSHLSQGLLFADEGILTDPTLSGEDHEHFAAQKFVLEFDMVSNQASRKWEVVGTRIKSTHSVKKWLSGPVNQEVHIWR